MKIYPRYENCSFDNFTSNAKIDVLKKPREIKNNIVIMGGVGVGKTHLAYAIINQESERKESYGVRYYSSDFVEYATVKEIIDNIRKCWKANADNLDFAQKEKYKTIPLLIIDEIGVQYGSDSERVELFDIFNERYNNMLPIIAISNYKRELIEKTLGLRIADRLFGGATIIEVNGKSHR